MVRHDEASARNAKGLACCANARLDGNQFLAFRCTHRRGFRLNRICSRLDRKKGLAEKGIRTLFTASIERLTSHDNQLQILLRSMSTDSVYRQVEHRAGYIGNVQPVSVFLRQCECQRSSALFYQSVGFVKI